MARYPRKFIDLRISLLVLIGTFVATPNAHASWVTFCRGLLTPVATYFDDPWEVHFGWAKPLKWEASDFWTRIQSGLFDRTLYDETSVFARLENEIATLPINSTGFENQRDLIDRKTGTTISYLLEYDHPFKRVRIYIGSIQLNGMKYGSSSDGPSFEFARICASIVRGLDRRLSADLPVRAVEIRGGNVVNKKLVALFQKNGFRRTKPRFESKDVPDSDWVLEWKLPAHY